MQRVRVTTGRGLDQEPSGRRVSPDLAASRDAIRAGNRATVRAVGAVDRRIGGVVRREVTEGDDPVAEIDPSKSDLLYGLGIPRDKTEGRLKKKEEGSDAPIRTIDKYNKAIGINAEITTKKSSVGIFRVREQLARAPDSPEDWALAGTDRAELTSQDRRGDNLRTWVTLLRQQRARIGLEDLGGGRAARKKIQSKGRFKKNRKQSQASAPRPDRLSPTDVSAWLDPARRTADAEREVGAMSAAKRQALDDWIYRAFFRRTSKLGIDFATQTLGAKVHFNTSADPDFDPAKGTGTMDPKGIVKMSGKKKHTAKNRAITISEYRHVQKLIAAGKIPPDAVKFYAE